jgi:hypothetical protein
MPVVSLDAAAAADVQHGRAVTATDVPEGTVALALEGDLLAIAMAEADGVIRPKVVLAG